MSKKKKIFLIILTVLVIPVLVYISSIVIAIGVFIFDIDCGDEVIKTFEMKSGYVLELHQENCGAMDGLTYNVQIKEKGDKKGEEVLFFEMVLSEASIEIEKENGKEIKIKYPSQAIVYDTEEKYKEINLTFVREGGDVNIPKEIMKYKDKYNYISIGWSDEIETFEEYKIQPYTKLYEGELGKKEWEENWIVIGEISNSMPIVAKKNTVEQIYILEQNNNKWEEKKISKNYKIFQENLNILEEELDRYDLDKRLKENEIKSILKELNVNEEERLFWEEFLKSLHPWDEVKYW